MQVVAVLVGEDTAVGAAAEETAAEGGLTLIARGVLAGRAERGLGRLEKIEKSSFQEGQSKAQHIGPKPLNLGHVE